MTCPHKATTEYGVIPASRRNTKNPLEFVFERQLRARTPLVSHLVTHNMIDHL